MELQGIIGAMVGGSLGALLVAQIVRRLVGRTGPVPEKQSVRALATVLVPVIVFGSIGARIATSDRVSDWINPPTRLERLTRKYDRELQRSPAVKKRLAAAANSAEARAVAMQLACAGIQRLDAPDLLRLNELRQALAARSPALCSSWLLGPVDSTTLLTTIETFNDADLDDWLRIGATAARLEAESTGPVVEDPDALDRALESLSSHLTPSDKERLDNAVMAGEEISDDEACWVMRTMMRTAGALEPPARDDALRALGATCDTAWIPVP